MGWMLEVAFQKIKQLGMQIEFNDDPEISRISRK
jgi:hypothetical protein